MRLSDLLLGLLAGTAFGLSCLKYRQRRIKLTEFLCWSAIWLLAAIAVILPDTTTFIARILDIGRGVEVIIYLSIVLSFYLIFRAYEKIDHLEREIARTQGETQILREQDREQALKVFSDVRGYQNNGYGMEQALARGIAPRR